MAKSGGIFLNSDMMFIKPFVVNIGIQFAFMAEIMAGIIVIEKVADLVSMVGVFCAPSKLGGFSDNGY